MAETRESRAFRPPVHALPEPNSDRARSFGGSPHAPQSLQLALRSPEALRLAHLPLPPPRSSRISSVAALLPQGGATPAAALHGPVPLRQFLPDPPGQHIRGAEAQAGVHRVASAFPRVVILGSHATGRGQEEFQHRLAEAEGERTRTQTGNAETER